MLSDDEKRYFEDELALHERTYLAGTNPRQQSGFGRDERDWERYRRPVVAAVQSDGTFLDIGCANGLLMESVLRWASEDGHQLEPYGLDISPRLADLARQRVPNWRERIFVGNALFWKPPFRFEYVRTEIVYVPASRRRQYIERLLEAFLAPDGRLLVCSYGSSRPEGIRAEALIDDIQDWGFAVEGVHDFRSDAHGFVITRVVSLAPAGMPVAIAEFGMVEPGATYVLRPGGYVVMFGDRGEVAVVSTPQGLALPGGGQYNGEAPEVAAVREVAEECGLRVTLGPRIGAADELVFAADERAHYRKRCTFFLADVIGGLGAGERDHELLWLSPAEAIAQLRHKSQSWAVGEACRRAGGCP
jgi:8-oxo-dGTP pyrophosphatase MutT (NUDIX family)